MLRTKKKLIIDLIEDDLKNTRLVLGLEKLGLDAGKYYLNLSQTFFRLLGFEINKQHNELYEEYLRYSEEVMTIDIDESPEQLTEMAHKVFDKLLAAQTQKASTEN